MNFTLPYATRIFDDTHHLLALSVHVDPLVVYCLGKEGNDAVFLVGITRRVRRQARASRWARVRCCA